MGCFVVAEFQLTSTSRGPSAIAEPLVHTSPTGKYDWVICARQRVTNNTSGPCLCMCVSEQQAYNFCARFMARWFNLIISKSYFKVEVVSQSYTVTQDEDYYFLAVCCRLSHSSEVRMKLGKRVKTRSHRMRCVAVPSGAARHRNVTSLYGTVREKCRCRRCYADINGGNICLSSGVAFALWFFVHFLCWCVQCDLSSCICQCLKSLYRLAS